MGSTRFQLAWVDAATRVPAIDRSPSAGEGFASGTHAFRSRGHRYQIYIPPEHAGHEAPLIVMLAIMAGSPRPRPWWWATNQFQQPWRFALSDCAG